MKNNLTKKDLHRKKLAQSLSEILNNPETPKEISESIKDAISFYSTYLDFDNQKVIEMILQSHEENADGRVMEVTRGDGISVVM